MAEAHSSIPTMKCNVCGLSATFRARAIAEPFSSAEPFSWWCQACYDVMEHDDLPHDIEDPILCCHCDDLPATMRIQSPSNSSYWCFLCYERAEHGDEPHHVHDLDSASDESDQEDEDELAMDSASLKSWHHVMQSPSDASSRHDIEDDCSSNSRFMLSYAVVDEYAQSNDSCTMVDDIAATAAI